MMLCILLIFFILGPPLLEAFLQHCQGGFSTYIRYDEQSQSIQIFKVLQERIKILKK